MQFERFEVRDLAHYSYAVGCTTVGKKAVVDPKRDVDTYLDFADTHGLEISHVLETNIQDNDADEEVDQYKTETGLQRTNFEKNALLKGVS